MKVAEICWSDEIQSAVDFAVPVKELSRVQQGSYFSLTDLLLGLFWIYNAFSVFKRLTTTLWSLKNASELKIYQKWSNFNPAVDFTVPVKEVLRAQHCSFFSMTDLLLGLFCIYNACNVFRRLTTTSWSFKNASEWKI